VTFTSNPPIGKQADCQIYIISGDRDFSNIPDLNVVNCNDGASGEETEITKCAVGGYEMVQGSIVDVYGKLRTLPDHHNMDGLIGLASSLNDGS
jgi:hypothetical protein